MPLTRALSGQGVNFLGEPMHEQGNRLVFFTDRDGNMVHLMHARSHSARPKPGPSCPAELSKLSQYRDFRLMWIGACTSSIGTWMQIVAQSWLVYRISRIARFTWGSTRFSVRCRSSCFPWSAV